jgi:RNA polymerase sigma factor (TIGR02999 family)
MSIFENEFQGEQGIWVIFDGSVYLRLCGAAARMLRCEHRYHGWEAADLVHEAFLRIARGRSPARCANRAHVYALTIIVMRHILTDLYRSTGIFNRSVSVPLEPELPARNVPIVDGIIVRNAFDRLRSAQHRVSQVVEMLAVEGMTIDEVALKLSVSSRTVKRNWKAAKEWIGYELGKSIAYDSERHLVRRRRKAVPPAILAPVAGQAPVNGHLREVA